LCCGGQRVDQTRCLPRWEGRAARPHDSSDLAATFVAKCAGPAYPKRSRRRLLRDEGPTWWTMALEVAQGVASAFEEFPHWRTSGHQEHEVRKAIYKALINGKVEGVIEVANGILKMLRRAGS